MSKPNLSVQRRCRSYFYLRERRLNYRTRAYKALGSKCSGCDLEDSPCNVLHLKFIDPADPLRTRYCTNPVVLHRRLCHEPSLRKRVVLLCHPCKLKGTKLG